jgi:hypothetical protein
LPIGLGIARCAMRQRGYDITDENSVSMPDNGFDICGMRCANEQAVPGGATLTTYCDKENCSALAAGDSLIPAASEELAAHIATVFAGGTPTLA